MARKPIIGMSLDAENTGSFSELPHYALRQNYVTAVEQAGGTTLLLPYNPADTETYLDLIDGLLIPGGDFDIPASYYGGTAEHETMLRKDARTEFEWAMLQGALQRDMPIFGICGGQQLVAVALGCTLLQHIPDEVPNALEHEVKDRFSPAHDIDVKQDSLLHRITKTNCYGVNTGHHQAVDSVPANVLASAHAPDGVIEAIESTTHRWCLGVQWHPEYLIHEQDNALFTAFIEACQNA